MDTSTTAELPKPKISGFAIFWLILILGCLCFFLVSMGFLGWGFYTVYQQVTTEQQVPYATATATADWPVVFRDDFGKVSDRWFTGDDQQAGYRDTRSIANGVYRWNLENALNYTFWSPAGAGNFKDFALAVDVRHLEGSLYDNYGLIFNCANGNYYSFAVQDSGYYLVSVWSAGNWNLVVPLTKSSAIRPGEFNHLAVLAEAGVYQLFINQEFVQQFESATLTSGDVGLMLNPQSDSAPLNSEPNGVAWRQATSNAKVEFDNFEVRAPEGSFPEQNLPPQLPQIEPENGKLVFVSDRDGNRNLYTIFTNGSGLKQLTDDPAADYAPRWSPDGKQIVFVSRRDGNAEIYLMDADGENLTRLTEHPAEDLSPDWSPDGQQIIFASKRNGNYDLYLMPVAGDQTDLRQLTETKFDEINPSISPAGTQVLFQAKDHITYNVYVMGIDGKNRKNLTQVTDTTTYSDPAWAPDSLQVVYSYKYFDEYEVVVGKADQIAAYWSGRQITAQQGKNLYPNWSPSGKQLVFVSDRDGQKDIYLLLPDGSGLFRVTHTEAAEESPDWTLP